jgi:hypothetical protein
MGVKLVASSGGSVEFVPTNTASNFTVTVPAKTGTMAMDGPTFHYYQTSSQTLANTTFTKLTFTTNTNGWDTTGGMYASSRFTPTVAGYYQINARVGASASNTGMIVSIYKNASEYIRGNESQPATALAGVTVSGLVYCNGSTDYIEIYGYFVSGQATDARQVCTYFQGSMVRGA